MNRLIVKSVTAVVLATTFAIILFLSPALGVLHLETSKALAWSAGNKTVTIVANNASPQFTGVYLSRGKHLTITASGSATYGINDDPTCNGTPDTDPDGFQYLGQDQCPNFKYDIWATMKDAPIGALIGKIGNGQWFIVGSSFTTVVCHSGWLFLQYNDSPLGGGYDGNTGGYTAFIEYS